MTLNITATGVIWWCLREPTWLVRPGGLVCRWFCEVSRYLLEVEPKAEISRRDSVANCLSLSASHFLFWLFGSSWWGQQLSGVGTFFMVCENARGPDKTTGWEFCSGPVGKREKIFAKKKRRLWMQSPKWIKYRAVRKALRSQWETGRWGQLVGRKNSDAAWPDEWTRGNMEGTVGRLGGFL